MAQFIQEVPRVSSAGIGGQAMVNVSTPNLSAAVGAAVNSLADAAQTFGSIYSEASAKDTVKTEISNLDATASYAQEATGAFGPPRPEEMALPPELKGYQKEFDIMRAAYASGGLSREKMQLLAGARVRDAIQEMPIFRDRIMQAAQGVLGFNVQSLEAQSWFGMFPTEGQLRDGTRKTGGKTVTEQWMEKAEAMHLANPALSVEFYYRQIALGEDASMRASIAKDMYDTDQISARDWLSQEDKADTMKGFQNMMHGVLTAYQKGEAVDPIAINSIVDVEYKQYVANIKSQYKGDTNSPEFIRFEEQAKSRYDGYKEFVNFVGVDNLNEVKLKRFSVGLELLGNELIPEIKFLEKNAPNSSDVLLNLLSNAQNQQQLDYMLRAFPTIKTLYDNVKDPAQFRKAMYDVGRVVVSGEGYDSLTEEQKTAVPEVAKKMFNDAETPEQADSVIKGLASAGMTAMPVSALASGSPMRVGSESHEFFKNEYANTLPVYIDNLAAEISDYLGRGVEVSWDDNGNLVVDRSALRWIQTSTSGLVDKVNMFNKAIDKGWHRIVGMSKEAHIDKVKEMWEASLEKARYNSAVTKTDNALLYLEGGNVDDYNRAIVGIKNYLGPAVDQYMESPEWKKKSAHVEGKVVEAEITNALSMFDEGRMGEGVKTLERLAEKFPERFPNGVKAILDSVGYQYDGQ